MPASYVIVTNATSNNLSLVGDDGKPRIDIPSVAGSNTENINVSVLVGNVLLCDTLSSWITSGYVTVTRGGVTVTAAQMTAFKAAMTSDIYDSDEDGISDKAEQLDFVSSTAIDDTDSPYTVLATDTVIDVDTSSGAVTVNLPAVAIANKGRNITVRDINGNAGTNNITIARNGTDEIDNAAADKTVAVDNAVNDLSSDGVDGWISDSAEAAAGTAHAASDGTSHANVVLNDTHRASDGIDHSYIQNNLVQVVITAVGGVSGATAGTISVQVNDLAGNPITRAVNIRLDISDTNMAGLLDAAGTCQFGAASTGTLIVGSGAAAAIVTTDATGLYEGALSNAADETNYFSASSTPGGAAAVANSCVVTQCAVANATWSA